MPKIAAILILLVAFSSPILKGAEVEEITLAKLETVAAALASPITSDRTAAETWLATHEADACNLCIEKIAHGSSAEATVAANSLAVLISPWARAVKQGQTHKGQVHLFLPVRPTGRVDDHPLAPAIREATFQRLSRFVNTIRMSATGGDEGQTSYPAQEETQLVTALCTCISEVMDQRLVNEVASVLREEPNRFIGANFIAILDAHYGLPKSYQLGGICGNSSPEEMERYEQQEVTRYAESRDTLIAYAARQSALSARERIESALDVWDEQLRSREDYAYYSDSGQWTTQTLYGSLIRMGEPAVEALRERANRAEDESFWVRGAYEIALATITGSVDNEFVNQMLAGETFEQMLACEMIAAAGSRDFKEPLTEMVQSNGPYRKASYTLAVIYRREAIPILKTAKQDDYIASCAIAELDAWGE